MSDEFDYYVLTWTPDNTIPRLEEDNKCPDYLHKSGPIDKPKLMSFRFGDPIPKKPQLVDYLASPKPVISKKVFDILDSIKIEGVQFLPAVIKDKNKSNKGYWAIHIYKTLKCVDPKLSDCKITGVRLSKVKKIVLDKKVLKKIPLEERLIFRLKEDTSYELFHRSIIDKIMEAKPSGIRFIPIEKWTNAVYFQD